MSSRLVLHIGTMKSGTTYLQNGFRSRREVFESHGWRYPGGELNQQGALSGLLGPAIPWVDEAEQRRFAPRGAALVKQSEEWAGDLLVSAEALASLDDEAAARTVGFFPGRRVHVVITARDLGRIIPSQLQQSHKSGSVETASHFLETIAREREEGTGTFWSRFDIAELVRRWSAVDRVDRVTVVTVPQSGAAPDELWTRFVAAAGWTDPALTASPEVEPAKANLSLSAPEVRFLIALNSEMRRRGKDLAYQRAVRLLVFNQGLATREPGSRGEKLRIPGDWSDRVAAWAAEDQARIAATGVEVVGDLDELLPRPTAGGADPTVPNAAEAETLAAAAHALLAVYDANGAGGAPGQRTAGSRPAPFLTRAKRAARRRLRR